MQRDDVRSVPPAIQARFQETIQRFQAQCFWSWDTSRPVNTPDVAFIDNTGTMHWPNPRRPLAEQGLAAHAPSVGGCVPLARADADADAERATDS